MKTVMDGESFLDFKLHVHCKWIKCLAGMGLAGNGVCFLGGDYGDEKCGRFAEDSDKGID